jgi:hypothetical protein
MHKSKTQQLLAFGTIAAIAALAACSGGGGSGTPAVHTTAAPIVTAPPAGSGLAPASFAVKIPGPGSSSISRRTQAVNATTTSMSFSLIKTDAAGTTVPQAAVTFDVSAGSALCTAGSAGARSCNLALNAPLGNDVYSVHTLDVHGNTIGSSAVTIHVQSNVANSASISLGGTVAGVLITPIAQAGDIFEGLVLDSAALLGPTSMRVLIIGFDGQGNVILTPDTFSTPINLVFLNEGPIILNSNATGHSRRTRAVGTDSVQASVVYANPNGGSPSQSTTDSGAPLIITSPNDVVTLTALSPPVSSAFVAIASVGPPPSPLPVEAPSPAPNGAANSLSGFVFAVAAVAPGSPAPLPVVASITWAADQPGMSAGPNQVFQFANAQAPGANITLTDVIAGGNPAAGTITISSPSWNTPGGCASEFASPTTFPITGTLDAKGTFTFLAQTLASGGATPPAPAPSAPIPTPFPTGGLTCQLIATDGNGITSTLTIDVNNPTGTIQ